MRLTYMIFFPFADSGQLAQWLSVYSQISSNWIGLEKPFCVLSLMEIQLVHRSFRPTASNLAGPPCRCCASELKRCIWLERGAWHLLEVFSVTVGGRDFVLHNYFLSTDFHYVFLRQMTRIRFIPSQLWGGKNSAFSWILHNLERAVVYQAGKGKTLSFTLPKGDPPTSCNTFPLRASFLLLQLLSSLWYIRVH